MAETAPYLASTAARRRVKGGAKVLQIFTPVDFPFTVRDAFSPAGSWMLRFVRHDLRFMLQCETNVIESVQQALADEFIDGKSRAEILARRALRTSPGQS